MDASLGVNRPLSVVCALVLCTFCLELSRTYFSWELFFQHYFSFIPSKLAVCHLWQLERLFSCRFFFTFSGKKMYQRRTLVKMFFYFECEERKFLNFTMVSREVFKTHQSEFWGPVRDSCFHDIGNSDSHPELAWAWCVFSSRLIRTSKTVWTNQFWIKCGEQRKRGWDIVLTMLRIKRVRIKRDPPVHNASTD